MNVVFFDYVCKPDLPGASGLSAKVWDMALALQKQGDNVHIVAPYSVETYPSSSVRVHRFRLPAIGYRNIFGHILIVLAGWREMKKLGATDVIHVPEYLSSGILSFLARRTPVILTTPGNIYNRIQNNASFDWVTDVVFKVTSWATVRYCAKIITTNRVMHQWWERTGASASQMVVIPNGVDVELFESVPRSKAILGFQEQTKTVLFVGRLLSRVKGLEYLFKAVQSLAVRRRDFRLHLIGEGPDREHLESLADKLGIRDYVVFHGWVDQMYLPLFYSAADVTVLPSFAEGQPRVMWEAMACGCPFLGTEGVVDGVVDDYTGFLVPPRDADALASRLERILDDEDLTHAVAERGCRYVRQNLSWDRIMQKIRAEVYTPFVVQHDLTGGDVHGPEERTA